MRLFTTFLLFFCAIPVFCQWQNMNGPFAGGALRFAGNGDYLFAANVNSVFRSSDQGLNWINTGTALPAENSYFEVLAQGARVLVTGRRAANTGAQRIVGFLSAGNGDNWTELTLPFTDAIFYYGFALSPQKIFAADGAHVWERSPGGGNWTLNALDADPNPFYNLSVQDGRLFAFGYKEIAVSTGLDGQNWTKIQVPGLNSVVTWLRAEGDTIFVEDYEYRNYRSTDGGITWKRNQWNNADVRNILRADNAWYGLYNYHTLVRSTDAGAHWTALGGAPALDQLDAANGRLFGHYYQGGSYRISGDGAVFERLGKGMTGGDLYDFTQDSAQILVACGFNGVHRFDKQTETWSAASIFPYSANIDAVGIAQGRIFAGVLYSNNGAVLYRSDDGGQTWLDISPSGNPPWPGPDRIQQILATDNVQFAFTGIPDNAIWRSTDFGENWTQAPGIYSKILARDSALFALKSGKFLYRSDDYGLSWTPLDTIGIRPAGNIDNFFLAGKRIFVNVKPPGGITNAYFSEDDGKTWTPTLPLTGGYGYNAFNTIVGYQDLVAGSAGQPALSTDGGKNWLPLGGNLPDVAAEIAGADANYVYTSVYDRGLWRLPWKDLSLHSVSGTVYHDQNGNYQRDPGEPPVPGVIVRCAGANTYAVSDAQGQYSQLLNLPVGAQETLSAHPPAPFNVVSPSTQTVNAAGGPADFAVQFAAVGRDLAVYATLLTPIRQSRNLTLQLLVRNEGGLPVSGRLYFTPDTKLMDYQFDPLENGLATDSFFWEIPPLQPGGVFGVSVRAYNPAPVSDLGQEYQFRATLEPAPADDILSNNAATTIDWTYPINAATWKNTDREELFLDEVQNGKTIVYTVSFQNPFPDTAVQVRIADYLDPDLDPSTLQILASSHPVRVTMQGDGYTDFWFDQILLPDTVADPTARGFVTYSVAPRKPVEAATYIHNIALVYFDNLWPPQSGGTVQTHISDRNTTGSGEPPAPAAGALKIIPNPNNGAFRIEAGMFSASGTATLRIIDRSGLLCLLAPFSGQELDLNLPAGLYIVQLLDAEKMAVGKMIVRK